MHFVKISMREGMVVLSVSSRPSVRKGGGQGHVLVQLDLCQGGGAGRGETGQGGVIVLFLGAVSLVVSRCLPD